MYNQLFSSLLFSPFTCRFIQENISLVKMLFNLLILQFPPVVLLYSVERKRKIYRWRPMWFQQTNLFKICLPRSLILFLFLIWFVDLDYMQTLASFASFCCYRFYFFSGAQLWFQNGFFNVVLLGTEIFCRWAYKLWIFFHVISLSGRWWIMENVHKG